ncbi:EAL domain-containing protein [Leptolyngbya sp. PCC 6406]|uniref:EAL domain-containing protein n=1 Tax=Leptolyngbya sp. PCC 6406 TaxID=1173264 RepID=UPI0002ACF94C|nr:EAL domain-containing protein [Leptolyngbya sp. PCC 6406]
MPDSIQSEAQNLHAVSSGLRLLIVEDVPEDVELMVLALDTTDILFQYDVASTLAQCQNYLTEHHYDAVLSDYRLPGLHAPQVLEVVQQTQPLTPFILITGSLGEEAAVECIKAGMTDYVLKDRLYRLVTVLQRALDEATLRRQKQAAITQVEEQAWRESILNQIVQAMRETLVLEEVLQNMVDQLHLALGVDYCAVVKPTPDQRMVIRFLSAQSGDGQGPAQRGYRDQLLGQPCDVYAQYASILKTHGQIILNADDPQLASEAAKFFATSGTQSLLATALTYNHTPYGILSLHQIQYSRRWTTSELSLVRAVAEQCAIAIYQVALYQRAQKELAQRRRMEDQLRHDAFHDALTGLPNRALFLDRLTHALQIAQRHRNTTDSSIRSFAVLFLDLDNFRMVNDSLGHDAGDTLLKVVAKRLNRCMRAGDTLAHTSGDEFAILLEGISGIDDITHIVETIHTALKTSIQLDTQEVFVSACIGVVFNGDDYSDAAQFLRDADTAMYQAKGQGRGQYQVFNESMHTQVKEHLRLENSLRRAISRSELTVNYQPILHLPSQRLCGFEALVRWQDPQYGLRQPDHFIPIAEQTGLILPIGQWVLEEACRQLQQWIHQWPATDGLHIAVNLSAKQFAQPNLIELVDQALAAANLSGRHLHLEVTESALLDNEETALHTLQEIRQRQIQVAMDDFGTGYSSLSYLLRFPKDVLKIDKSFVSQLEENLEHQEIIKTILTLGSNLGLAVVAEGIETAEQAEFLLNHGCLYGQGYWFYPPLNAETAGQLLAAEQGSGAGC